MHTHRPAVAGDDIPASEISDLAFGSEEDSASGAGNSDRQTSDDTGTMLHTGSVAGAHPAGAAIDIGDSIRHDDSRAHSLATSQPRAGLGGSVTGSLPLPGSSRWAKVAVRKELDAAAAATAAKAVAGAKSESKWKLMSQFQRIDGVDTEAKLLLSRHQGLGLRGGGADRGKGTDAGVGAKLLYSYSWD
jgi:hypothetical protein